MALEPEIERLVCLLMEDLGAPLFTHGGKYVVTCCQNISPVIQKGPMCGFVGLAMAAQLLCLNGQASDQIHPESILEYAVQKGLSRRGEMFSASAMEEIAVKHLHLQAQVATVDYHEGVHELVVQTVSGKRTVLVPYDADKDHTPCLARGHCAHWCLLVGIALITGSDGMCTPMTPQLLESCQQVPSNNAHYVVKETHAEDFTEILRRIFDSETLKESLAKNLIYVFSRHGKTSHLGLWSLRDLILSNGNLAEIDPQRSDPLEYVIPEGGLEEGLRNKVVFVAK